MSDTLFVTPAQVLAAKLAVELSEEAGEVPAEALEAIANAEVVVAEEQSVASTQRSRASALDQLRVLTQEPVDVNELAEVMARAVTEMARAMERLFIEMHEASDQVFARLSRAEKSFVFHTMERTAAKYSPTGRETWDYLTSEAIHQVYNNMFGPGEVAESGEDSREDVGVESDQRRSQPA
jgi:hypothetical protein